MKFPGAWTSSARCLWLTSGYPSVISSMTLRSGGNAFSMTLTGGINASYATCGYSRSYIVGSRISPMPWPLWRRLLLRYMDEFAMLQQGEHIMPGEHIMLIACHAMSYALIASSIICMLITYFTKSTPYPCTSTTQVYVSSGCLCAAGILCLCMFSIGGL